MGNQSNHPTPPPHSSIKHKEHDQGQQMMTSPVFNLKKQCMNMVWTELHLIIQQDKRKEMRGCRGRRWRWQRMDFPLCVAMATAVDGGWLISCTAVELGGERERGTRRYLCGGGRRWSSVRKASIFSLKLWGYLWWLGFFSAWMLHEWLFVLCRWIFFEIVKRSECDFE